MDIMHVIVTTAVTALVSGIVGALVATGVGAIKDKARHESDADKALKDGMRALLWRELKNIHSEAVERGGMDTAERKHLESVFKAYKGINGNGTGERLFNDAMNLPIFD